MLKTIIEEKAWFNMVASLLCVTVFTLVVIFVFDGENTSHQPPANPTSHHTHSHARSHTTPHDAGPHAQVEPVSHQDYFTNFGMYMPRTHCLLTAEGETDWFWVITLIVLNVSIVLAYLRIYYFWCKSYIMVPRQDRNTKLMDLAQVFLWCAITSYVSAIVIFVWPAYRLTAICLLVLNIWSWRFAFNLKSFGVSFSAKRYQRLAQTDPLTTLLNRYAFQRYLSEKVKVFEPGDSLAVLFLDFDRFKIINDSYGHDVGDQLLISISRRLCDVMNQFVRESIEYKAGRIGGDEFVIAIYTQDQSLDLQEVSSKLIEGCNQPHRIESYEIHSAASIGIVEYETEYDKVEDIIKDADAAMYHAKQQGKNCAVRFDAKMRQVVLRREQLSRDIYEAITTNLIRCLYQPIIDLTTGKTVAVETSMCWEHPEHGVIDAKELYQVAHANDLKSTLEKTMIHYAMMQLNRWSDGKVSHKSPIIQMGVSNHLLLDDQFVEWFLALAQEQQIPHEKLNLIVDADTVNHDFKKAVKRMKQLSDAGIKIVLSIDGLSYSSLSALHDLPVHEIRIAHDITNEPVQKQETLALLHALITLAANLNLKTSVRNITHTEQLAIIQSFGCDYALGELFLQTTTSDAMTVYLMSKQPFPPLENKFDQVG